MDYKKYSQSLENIIKDIDLPDHTRVLVDRLVKMAKRDAQDNTDLLNKE
jgi:hypothetical protein